MANLNEPAITISCYSFADFPEDVQLCVLSFLTPAEIANFACTSKQSVSICRSDSKLWYTLCERRWGCKTQIRNWGNDQISYKFLYKTLDKWENLIGFWRRCGNSYATTRAESPSLIFFEWGPSFLSGSRVSPSRNGTYHVIKSPFLYLGISPEGQIVNFLDFDGCNGEISVNIASYWKFGYLDNNLIPVNVNFMGNSYFTVEENRNLNYSSPESNKNGFTRSSSSSNLRGEEEEAIEVEGGTPGSLPEMSEMYQHFANRTSTVAARRQRRREKERQATRRRWETEHFIKVVECSPTLARPLQGLWKGFRDDMNLEFYLVAYDLGGITCRRVRDLSEHLIRSAPVFWTSKPTFIEPPFPTEEESLYASRIHQRPLAAVNHREVQYSFTGNEEVIRIVYINSSYDLVIPGLTDTSPNPRDAEGRIWQYRDGTFGFGFLRDNFVIDLKHIAKDGFLMDAVGQSGD